MGSKKPQAAHNTVAEVAATHWVLCKDCNMSAGKSTERACKSVRMLGRSCHAAIPQVDPVLLLVLLLLLLLGPCGPPCYC
jgi:hypothetical protein